LDNVDIDYTNIAEKLTPLYVSAKPPIQDIADSLPLPPGNIATEQDPNGPKPPDAAIKFGPLKNPKN
jgi:hypothetical protein